MLFKTTTAAKRQQYDNNRFLDILKASRTNILALMAESTTTGHPNAPRRSQNRTTRPPKRTTGAAQNTKGPQERSRRITGAPRTQRRHPRPPESTHPDPKNSARGIHRCICSSFIDTSSLFVKRPMTTCI